MSSSFFTQGSQVTTGEFDILIKKNDSFGNAMRWTISLKYRLTTRTTSLALDMGYSESLLRIYPRPP